jgi:hypothetical protein
MSLQTNLTMIIPGGDAHEVRIPVQQGSQPLNIRRRSLAPHPCHPEEEVVQEGFLNVVEKHEESSASVVWQRQGSLLED